MDRIPRRRTIRTAHSLTSHRRQDVRNRQKPGRYRHLSG